MTNADTSDSTGAGRPTVGAPLALEFIAPEVLGMDPDVPAGTELMWQCVDILRQFALHPDGVRLVVTADFVASVRGRSVTEHQQQNYNVARNAGEVGGKTMPQPDGTVDVLLPALLFVPDPDDAVTAARATLATRTTAHEAFHVAMHQAGETATNLNGELLVRGTLLQIADAVMEEYRAEVSLSEALPTEWEPLPIVTHLRDALQRIACVEYQEHLNVERLYQDITLECLHAWQLLAYVVAARTRSDGTVAALPAEVTREPLWTWIAAPHWSAFTRILSKFPPGLARAHRDHLEPLVAELADELHAWLETLGFRWRQIGEGSEFLIVDWPFDD